MKKTLSFVLSVIMVLAFALQASAFKANPKFSFTKYKEPIKLTFHTAIGSDVKFRDGESLENNPFTRWAKNEIGIIWSTKFVSPTNEDGKTKLNLLMASGDLPDVIFGETPQLGVLASSGYLMPLNNLINKYGSPLLKDRIKAAQDATGGKFFSPYTSNGKIYAMPTDCDVWGRTFYNTFIRSDILKALGKEVPQTLAQFEDVLAAYKAKYPNGVGVFLDKDLVPNSVNQMSPAMQPYGAYPGRWVVGADGKLVYGSTLPETKKGLETLKKWYANGWLDKEFIVKDFNKAVETMSAGNMLSITGDWWYSYWPFPDVVKNTPGATFAATSLKRNDGKVKLVTANPFDYAIAISSKCKHPEALIYQLNEMMDSVLRNDTQLRARMKKDYGYDFKYPVEADSAKKAVNPKASQVLQNFVVKTPGPGYFRQGGIPPKIWPGFEFDGEIDLSYKKLVDVGNALKNNKKNSLTADESAMLNDLDKVNKTGSAVIAETNVAQAIRNNMVVDGFLGSPTPTMVEKNAYLLKLENETFAKIILGAGSADEFEKFVAEWKKAGGDKITEEVNAWYEKSK